MNTKDMYEKITPNHNVHLRGKNITHDKITNDKINNKINNTINDKINDKINLLLSDILNDSILQIPYKSFRQI
jgi:hypothetical protein